MKIAAAAVAATERLASGCRAGAKSWRKGDRKVEKYALELCPSTPARKRVIFRVLQVKM